MPKSVNLAVYVPPIISDVAEFIQIFKTENPQFNTLLKAVDDCLDDQFIYSATENGISRWEKILDIELHESDTLDDRRFTILTKLNGNLPYTYRSLEQRLDALVGTDGYVMEYINETWTLKVRVALAQQKQYNEVLKVLNETVPANLAIDYGVLYNIYGVLTKYKYSKLKAYTYKQLKETLI